MKKLSKLLAILAGVSALFFASCADVSSGGGTVSSSAVATSTSSNPKDYRVSFAAENNEPLDLESLGLNTSQTTTTSDGRTIVAESIDLSKSGVYFYLWGTNDLTDEDLDPEEVTFVADEATDGEKVSTGTITIDKATSKYHFVLAVTTKQETGTLTTDSIATIKGDAVYIGYANVDLRNGDEIKFYVSADGLKGKGGYKLTLKPDDSWSDEDLDEARDYAITADIYNRLDGKLVTGTTAVTPTNSANFYDRTTDGCTVERDKSVTPGTYNFIVQFTKSGKTYEYSDIIIILPNQNIEKTILIPHVIESYPLAPQAFKVAYVAPSYDTDEEYNVVLEWSDKSNNETSFIIEYINVSSKLPTGTGAVNQDMADKFIAWQEIEATYDKTDDDQKAIKDAADKAWTDITSVDTYTCDTGFYGNSINQNWVAGSLQRNNEHAVIRVSLGKRYLFRIAAKNTAGSSYYTYATYGTDIDWTDSSTSANYPGKAFTTTKGVETVVKTTLTKAKDAAGDVPTITYYKEEACTTAYTTDELKVAPATADDTTEAYYKKTVYNETYEDDDGNEQKYISITANLYRLSYFIGDATYEYWDSTNSIGKKIKTDIVQYKSQGDVEIICPSNPIEGTTKDDYPKLYNTSNKRWTSWKVGGTTGDDYGTAAHKKESGGNFIYVYPGTYTFTQSGSTLNGYQNLYLFANYSSNNAALEAYNDADYDLRDKINGVEFTKAEATAAGVTLTFYANASCTNELSAAELDALGNTAKVYAAVKKVTGKYAKANTGNTYYSDKACKTTATVSDTTDDDAELYLNEPDTAVAVQITGTDVTQTALHAYTVKSTTDAVQISRITTVNNINYSVLKVEVTRGSRIATGELSSNQYQLKTSQLPIGTYTIKVIATYKGHTYAYPMVLTITD